jgi:hypothetical protein
MPRREEKMQGRAAVVAVLGLVLGLVLVASRADATNVIRFEAVGSGFVSAGDSLEVTLLFDFSDPTVGGGLDLIFSRSVLQFESFAFSDDLGRDPAFDLAPGAGSTADPLVIAFGNFAELSGQRTIGTARFEALVDLVLGGAGPSLVSGRDNAAPAGPFYGSGPLLLSVQYQGLSGVPEPATLVLLAGGLVLTAGHRRVSREPRRLSAERRGSTPIP